VNRGYGSLLRDENARRSERRREIVRDCLFARVAHEADKDDERADGDRQEPREHLRRGGLKPADLAELAILLLKFEGLGTEQGTCHGGTRRLQYPCPEVANSPRPAVSVHAFDLPRSVRRSRPIRRRRAAQLVLVASTQFSLYVLYRKERRAGSIHAYRDDAMLGEETNWFQFLIVSRRFERDAPGTQGVARVPGF
jgi:hypothetical protein